MALSHKKTGTMCSSITVKFEVRGLKHFAEGQQVEFGLVTRDKGPAAEDVVPTD